MGIPRTLAYFNRAPEKIPHKAYRFTGTPRKNERSEARFLGKRSNRPKDETDK